MCPSGVGCTNERSCHAPQLRHSSKELANPAMFRGYCPAFGLPWKSLLCLDVARPGLQVQSLLAGEQQLPRSPEPLQAPVLCILQNAASRSSVRQSPHLWARQAAWPAQRCSSTLSAGYGGGHGRGDGQPKRLRSHSWRWMLDRPADLYFLTGSSGCTRLQKCHCRRHASCHLQQLIEQLTLRCQQYAGGCVRLHLLGRSARPAAATGR